MGKQYDERGEIADARARMSDLALELARRASPEHLKEVAKDKAVELKAHAKDIAKGKAFEMRDRAKETAMQKTQEWKYEATHTPKGVGILGALLGAGIGSFIARKVLESRQGSDWQGQWQGREWQGGDYQAGYGSYGQGYNQGYGSNYGSNYGYSAQGYTSPEMMREPGYVPSDVSMGSVGYEGSIESDSSEGGMKAKAEHLKDKVAEKAGSVKEKVSHATDSMRGSMHDRMHNARWRASEMRENVPSMGEMRRRGSDWYNESVREQPLIFGLGALALGLIGASLLPVTSKERRLVEPAKRKVQERVQQAGQMLNDKLGTEQQSGSSEWQGQQSGSWQGGSTVASAGSDIGTGSVGVDVTVTAKPTDVSFGSRDVMADASATPSTTSPGTKDWNKSKRH